MDEKNIQLAIDVSQALPEAKIDIQFNFWEELNEKLASKNYKMFYLDDYSYTQSMVEKFHQSGRKPRHYGLLIEMHDLGDSNILLFYILLNWSLYYGFSVYQREENDWVNAEEEKFDHLFDIIKTIDNDFTRTSNSIGWKDQNRRLDFETFNSQDMFALADTIKRSRIIDDLVDEISSIIDKFNEGYEKYISDAKRNHKNAT